MVNEPDVLHAVQLLRLEEDALWLGARRVARRDSADRDMPTRVGVEDLDPCRATAPLPTSQVCQRRYSVLAPVLERTTPLRMLKIIVSGSGVSQLSARCDLKRDRGWYWLLNENMSLSIAQSMIPSFSTVAPATTAGTWLKWVSAFCGSSVVAKVNVPPYSGALTMLPVLGSSTISFSHRRGRVLFPGRACPQAGWPTGALHDFTVRP